MKVKQHKYSLFLLFVIATFVFASATIFSFAFFTGLSQSVKAPEFTLDDSSSNAIPVGTVEQLFKYGTDTTHNSNNPESNLKDRKTLVLINNLTLKSNVILTADVHLDLNGNTLDLNGYTITFRHNYHGLCVVSNGNVTAPFETYEDENKNVFLRNSPSRMVIDTPNACVIFDNVKVLEGLANIQGSTTYEPDYSWNQIIQIDKTLVANNALKMINTTLCDYFDDSKPYYTVADTSLITYKSAAFYDDIDLPQYFYNYKNLKIEYTTNNPALKPSGKVTPPSVGTIEEVTLTATVAFDDVVVTKDFPVKIINKDDGKNWAKLGTDLIVNYLENYKHFNEAGVFEYYLINESLYIPEIISNYNATFVYETLDEQRKVLSKSGVSGTNFLKVDNKTQSGYTMILDILVRELRITCNVGAENYVIVLPTRGEGNAIFVNNYTRAIAIVRELYGTRIVVKDSEDPSNSLNGYTIQELYQDVKPYESQGVRKIEYKLVNNIDRTYNISQLSPSFYGLYVDENRYIDPNIMQTIFLSIIFTFNTEPYTVKINIPVVYDPSASGKEITFEPYYNYFHKQFISETKTYTYNSFTVPFTFGATYPIYYFDIIDKEENVLSNNLGQLVIDGKIVITQHLTYTKDNGQTVSYTYEQFKALDKQTILNIVLSGNARWHINIDTNNIPLYDTNIMLRYRYKLLQDSKIWAGQGDENPATGERDLYLSGLTIPGIIRNEPNQIPDSNLYKKIFAIYHPQEVYQQNKTFIINSRLSNEINEISFKDNANLPTATRVNNFKGINYLIGVKRLDLQNALVSIITTTYQDDEITETTKNISYIKDMIGLEYLNLSDNRLRDRLSNSKSLPTGPSNRFLSDLSVLYNLKELHLENSDTNAQNNNHIYEFRGLEKFFSLQTVYLQENKFVSTYYTISILLFVNDIYTGIINSLYGSEGGVNQTTYSEIYGKTDVFYKKDATGALVKYDPSQATSNYYDIFVRLKSIEYQQKLANGIDINNVYNNFSPKPDSYGIHRQESIKVKTSDGTKTIEFLSHEVLFGIVQGDDPLTTNRFEITYMMYYTYMPTGLSQPQNVDIPIAIEVTLDRYT